jgi:Amt family ammonium transporter
MVTIADKLLTALSALPHAVGVVRIHDRRPRFAGGGTAPVGTLSLAQGLNDVWVVLAAALVLFMEGGFALLEAGLVRPGHGASVIMKVWMDLSAGSVAYWLLGFGLMFGADRLGLIGVGPLASVGRPPLLPPNLSPYAFWLFEAAFAVAAVSIVSGAVAERVRPRAYLLFVLFMCGVIYPVAGHWVWGGGWLQRLGMRDFAGSGVVHALGGWAALAAALVLGARSGRWQGHVRTSPSNLGLAAAGTFILWFGWFGFNAGSTLSATSPLLARVALNTQLAAATGGVLGYLWPLLVRERCDGAAALNGALGGLVAITAGCAYVGPEAALLIGAVGGWLAAVAPSWLERWHVDDPVGAVAVHGFGGSWGVLAVGLFAQQGGLFSGGGPQLLGIQALGLLALGAWGFGASWLVFRTLAATVGVRASVAEEAAGLDLAWGVWPGIDPQAGPAEADEVLPQAHGRGLAQAVQGVPMAQPD